MTLVPSNAAASASASAPSAEEEESMSSSSARVLPGLPVLASTYSSFPPGPPAPVAGSQISTAAPEVKRAGKTREAKSLWEMERDGRPACCRTTVWVE